MPINKSEIESTILHNNEIRSITYLDYSSLHHTRPNPTIHELMSPQILTKRASYSCPRKEFQDLKRFLTHAKEDGWRRSGIWERKQRERKVFVWWRRKWETEGRKRLFGFFLYKLNRWVAQLAHVSWAPLVDRRLCSVWPSKRWWLGFGSERSGSGAECFQLDPGVGSWAVYTSMGQKGVWAVIDKALSCGL